MLAQFEAHKEFHPDTPRVPDRRGADELNPVKSQRDNGADLH